MRIRARALARNRAVRFSVLWLIAAAFVSACAPTVESNILGYLIGKRMGTLAPHAIHAEPGELIGKVTDGGSPIDKATVVVADRFGTPYVAQTGPDGTYHIQGIPPGQYVPAAVGPGYSESVPTDFLGIQRLVTIHSGKVTNAPDIKLQPHVVEALPLALASAVQLNVTDTYSATSNFPAGTAASVQAYQFEFNDETVDTLRLYLPLDLAPGEKLPLLFMIYPSHTDGWQSVSAAFAASGYAMVAISPMTQRGIDIDAHALDARVAFTLARSGVLSPHIAPGKAVALGGSFSSAILNRFLRDEAAHVAAWITVGGISNAFSGAADFYAGELEMPPQFELAIPALGPPNIYPLPFLRYSPVYTAQELPPTMVIHTAVDRITPIDQAYQLEEALLSADIPVDVFYYEDVSHYLQIGDDLTESGAEMFYRILDYIERYQEQE